jgi:hypothetical protein
VSSTACPIVPGVSSWGRTRLARIGREQDHSEREGLLWRLEVIEKRREQADAFTWAVPGLAVAAQAFLLSIVLRGDVTSLARLLASLAGLIAALAAMHLYAKDVYTFDIYEAVIEAERKQLGLPGVQLDALRKITFPDNTQYVKRGWATKWWRQHLIVRRPAATVWLVSLAGFAVIDLLLLAYAIVSLAGGDPGWFVTS